MATIKSIEEKAKAYDEAIERAKNYYCTTDSAADIKLIGLIFPELKESEDERIVKELLAFFRECVHGGHILTNKEYDSWIAWLEKQGKQKPNPYSGTSFEYNGHTWGMCARDNGVDILLDSQLFRHLEKQGEQKPVFEMKTPEESLGVDSDTYNIGNSY